MIIIKKRILFVLMLILLSYSVFGSLDIALKKTDYGPNQALDGSFNFSFSGKLDADIPVIVSVNSVSFEERLDDFLGVTGTAPSYSKSERTVSTATIIFKEGGSNTSYGIDLTQKGGIIPDEIIKLIFNVSGDKYENTNPMLPSIRLGDILVWNYRGEKIAGEYINPGIPYLKDFRDEGVSGIKPFQAFCQKTTVKAAPEYKIVAEVLKEKEGYILLAFIIDDIESESIPNSCGTGALCCEITNVGSEFARKDCIIDRGINFDSEKYLCLKLSGTGDSTVTYYKIKKEVEDNRVAGYFIDDDDNVYQHTNTDYFIWYEFAKFETNLSGKVNLSDFTDFVNEDYPYKGDLIPITVMTKGKGKIQLIELFTDVQSDEGPSSEYNKFTPISYTPAKVTYSGTKTQDLSAGFLSDLLTPVEEGTYSLTVTIGGETKSKTINVVSRPFAWIMWEPEFPGVNQKVIFNGSESYSPDGLNITDYEWDFGDGITGTGKIVEHIYNKTDDFNVVLTVTDSNGVTGIDEFVITIRSLIGDVGVALNATGVHIKSMADYISGAEEHVKDSAELLGINTILSNATTELSLLRIRYEGALSKSESIRETEIGKISSDLYVLMNSVPRAFSVDSFKFSAKIVNTGEIPDSSKLGVQVSDDESFKQELLSYQEGIDIKAEARLVYIIYISERDESFILVKKTVSGQGLKGNIYEAGSNIKDVLTEGYEAVVPDSVYRWPADKRDIVYTVDSDDVNLTVGSRTFVVPPLSELGKIGSEILGYGFDCGNDACDEGEDRISCPEDCKQRYPVGFIIFLIVLTVIGVWYINFYHGKFGFKTLGKDIKNAGKMKDQNILKSEEDLLNLMNYIKNSLKKGMTIQQIRYTLMQKGWKEIQINEALKQAKNK